MRRIFLIPLLVLCLPFGSAMAHRRHMPDIDAREVATSAGLSVSLYSTFRDDKIVTPAREDLSSFVASGGAIRDANLESMLMQARHDHPGLQASDEELAQALLVQDQLPAGQ
ncbi:threonine ammonia-lyase [Pseudomonas sp. FW306-02-F02-AA]|uniref:DUF2388 domain-containing protein n=1 Tax=Pseudomonas fluorescens TaxID=294 RepID=A0A0N9WGR4_PSEFL|nr:MULTISPECIES: DUF2388 domain-containing protein [Pseudomonas]ALI03859.1 hypothetical protein AO353_23345 [Pseudomonas fluorescens]PMZ04785.1 threonine ammonia-lyase [Pseudomonas sp. FW306-02-F02-AB]PMZ11949.1 threonine ammonia-lyase [Pseudomonas sp. FW306-02-H06C]PMZ12951.1 threonine ammonia-lyase [Pseudomonas sp. FW306-02-F02-AA]PMZ18591.1 threonine ammonia-lyase [Pseudomonas sp. FW306-02-F08-AA]